MCPCGCAQMLGECDHVGCPDRDTELAELSAGIAAGKSDQQILDAFVAKYGAMVLAAPPTRDSTWWHGLRRSRCLRRRCWERFCWSGAGADWAARRQLGRDCSWPSSSTRQTERLERIRRETGANDGF